MLVQAHRMHAEIFDLESNGFCLIYGIGEVRL